MLDINECNNEEDNNCHKYSICTNTNGSFTCQCQNEYIGNGTTCTGKWLPNIITYSTYDLVFIYYLNSQILFYNLK